jgi:hypothetical protein
MSSQYFFTLNKKINKGQILYAFYNTLSLKESIERSLEYQFCSMFQKICVFFFEEFIGQKINKLEKSGQ